MAVAARGGRAAIWREDVAERVIFHTDRGSTYTANAFTVLCRELGFASRWAGWGRVSTTPPLRRSSRRWSGKFCPATSSVILSMRRPWSSNGATTSKSPTAAHCSRWAIARQLRDQGIKPEAASGLRNPPRSRGSTNSAWATAGRVAVALQCSNGRASEPASLGNYNRGGSALLMMRCCVRVARCRVYARRAASPGAHHGVNATR